MLSPNKQHKLELSISLDICCQSWPVAQARLEGDETEILQSVMIGFCSWIDDLDG